MEASGDTDPGQVGPKTQALADAWDNLGVGSKEVRNFVDATADILQRSLTPPSGGIEKEATDREEPPTPTSGKADEKRPSVIPVLPYQPKPEVKSPILRPGQDDRHQPTGDLVRPSDAGQPGDTSEIAIPGRSRPGSPDEILRPGVRVTGDKNEIAVVRRGTRLPDESIAAVEPPRSEVKANRREVRTKAQLAEALAAADAAREEAQRLLDEAQANVRRLEEQLQQQKLTHEQAIVDLRTELGQEKNDLEIRLQEQIDRLGQEMAALKLAKQPAVRRPRAASPALLPTEPPSQPLKPEPVPAPTELPPADANAAIQTAKGQGWVRKTLGRFKNWIGEEASSAPEAGQPITLLTAEPVSAPSLPVVDHQSRTQRARRALLGDAAYRERFGDPNASLPAAAAPGGGEPGDTATQPPSGEKKGLFGRFKDYLQNRHEDRVDYYRQLSKKIRGKLLSGFGVKDLNPALKTELGKWEDQFYKGDLSQGSLNGHQIATLLFHDRIGSRLPAHYRTALEQAGFNLTEIVELKKFRWEQHLRKKGTKVGPFNLGLINNQLFNLLSGLAPLEIHVDKDGRSRHIQGRNLSEGVVKRLGEEVKTNWRNMLSFRKGERDGWWYAGYLPNMTLGLLGGGVVSPLVMAGVNAAARGVTWKMMESGQRYGTEKDLMDKVIAGEGKGSRTAARIARFSSSKGAQAILKAVNHGTRGAAAGAMAAGLANVMDLALPFRQGLVDYNLPGRLVGSAPDNVAAGGGIPAGEAPSNSPYGYNAANPEVNYAGSPVSPSGSEGGVSGNLVGVTPGGGLPGGEQAVPGAQDLVINVTQEPTANTVWEAARNTAKNLVEGTDWTNAATGADKTEVLGDFIKDILEAKGQSIQTVQPGTSFDLTKILDPDQLIQFNQLVGQINATTDVTSYIPVHNQVVDFVASLKS